MSAALAHRPDCVGPEAVNVTTSPSGLRFEVARCAGSCGAVATDVLGREAADRSPEGD